jgi:ferritin-like metal-binding protein YciE
MAKAAASEELQQAFEEHLEQTEEQVERLEQVFEICEIRPQAKKCDAMEGLVSEAQDIISEHEEGVVRDTALIIAGQKVEHYEIASYGSLRTLAQVLGYDDAVDLLQMTLDEEGEADKNLTAIASTLNQIAMEESEGMEEKEDEEEMA